MNKIPMHAVCVGRMMADLPKGGTLDWQQQFGHAKVNKLPADVDSLKKFDAMVFGRRSQLDKRTADNPDGVVKNFSKINNKEYVVQYADPSIPAKINTDPSVKTERYLWLGVYGYSFVTGWLSLGEAAGLLSLVNDIPRHVEGISNFNPPAKPGFCIDSAMVVGKIGPIWSGPSARVPRWKGVAVSAGASEDDGSREPPPWQQTGHAVAIPTPFDDLEMMRDWARYAKQRRDESHVVSFRVLREEQKNLAGMKGEEIAVSAELSNGQRWYRFEWSSVDDSSRSDKSGFSLGLEAGANAYTSRYVSPPAEDDLLALWDAMLESLRPRLIAR